MILIVSYFNNLPLTKQPLQLETVNHSLTTNTHTYTYTYAHTHTHTHHLLPPTSPPNSWTQSYSPSEKNLGFDFEKIFKKTVTFSHVCPV